MAPRFSSLAQLTTALAIAGCSANIAPIEVAAGCPSQPLRSPARFASDPELQLIDDFEHQTPSLPRVGGRDGGWVLGTDNTSMSFEAKVSDRCAGRGQRAGHFSGKGFSSWGANWTAVVRSQPSGSAVAYDATPYNGVSFWAALGSDTAGSMSLPVGVTTLDVAWNGGICTKCMDYYRTTVEVEHAWRRFEFSFNDLAQSGSGEPQVTLRRDRFVGVIFWPDHDFDLWIDDLRFEQ